jgi:putative transcriptional regulator
MATNEHVGDLILEGLREALAYEQGVIAATTRVRVTGRTAQVAAPPTYTPEHVRAIRQRVAVSQAVFAATLGVSESTVEAWEQGRRVPDGAARRLLEIAEEHPDVLLAKVHTSA